MQHLTWRHATFHVPYVATISCKKNAPRLGDQFINPRPYASRFFCKMVIRPLFVLQVPNANLPTYTYLYTDTHTHTYIYIQLYIYIIPVRCCAQTGSMVFIAGFGLKTLWFDVFWQS